MSIRSLTVSLTHVSGPIGRPPRQNLSLFLSGFLMDDLHASGSVTLQSGTMTEFPVGPMDFEGLCRTAEAAGLIERVPNVTEVQDTSNRWSLVLLHVAHEKGSHNLSLSLLSSGFRGPDAPALQKFFDRLLTIAGVKDDVIRHDLTGF